MAPPQRRRHKQQLPPIAPHPPPSPSAFAAALSEVAVAQICLSAGYSAAEPSALRALSDVASRCLQALGRSAASVASAHGRNESNLLDLARAIEDLSAARGFAGAGDPTVPPLQSGALRELMAFVDSVDEIPFPRPIRRDGKQKTQRDYGTSFAAAGREPPFRHVPRWLPCFPEEPWGREGKELGMRGVVEEEERVAETADDGGGCEGKKMVGLPAKRKKVRFRLGAAEVVRKRRG